MFFSGDLLAIWLFAAAGIMVILYLCIVTQRKVTREVREAVEFLDNKNRFCCVVLDIEEEAPLWVKHGLFEIFEKGFRGVQNYRSTNPVLLLSTESLIGSPESLQAVVIGEKKPFENFDLDVGLSLALVQFRNNQLLDFRQFQEVKIRPIVEGATAGTYEIVGRLADITEVSKLYVRTIFDTQPHRMQYAVIGSYQ